MTRRSPARLLAPLALVVAALSILLVVNSERSTSDSPSSSTTTPTSSTPTSKAKSTSTSSAAGRSTSVPATTKNKARTYTVKPGDVPSSIAEQAGTTVAELLELNDITDPQSLSVGQKLKLP
jgi:LysM repeat protein